MNFIRYVVVLALFIAPYSQATEHHEDRHPDCNYPTSASDNIYRFNADLDGVHGTDIFVADRSDGTTIIYSCDDDTLVPWDMGDANKPVKLIVIDIEGDGKDELLVGGPTATSPLTASVDSLVGTDLVSRYFVSFNPVSTFSAGKTFGCLDTDSNGLREVINYTYTESDDRALLSWLSSDGRKGRFKLPEEATRAWMFRSGLCGKQIAFNYELLFLPSELQANLKAGSTILMGINNQILSQKTAEELEDSSNWLIPVEHFAGYEGPFVLLPLMEKAQRITVGEHNHCIGRPLEPPAFDEANLIQLSLQPTQTDSCLNWFAIDFWVREDFSIAAIILNIWEP